MLLGVTALTMVIAIPAIACWPAAGYLVYRVARSGKHHEESDAVERARLLAIAAEAAKGTESD